MTETDKLKELFCRPVLRLWKLACHAAILNQPYTAAILANALNRWLWHVSCAECKCRPAKGH